MYGDRYTGQQTGWARVEDVALRLDRCCPEAFGNVQPRNAPAEIIGERQQRTAMDDAAPIEVPLIDIDFTDELVLICAGDPNSEVFRHAGTQRGRCHCLSLSISFGVGRT
jgi:hypothetical protein